MRIARLFLPRELSSGARLELDDAQTHRLTRVLRLREGDALYVFDGRGGEYLSHLRHEGRQWMLAIGEHTPREAESPLRITLAQSISRNERMDFALQKAVELGVSEIQPLVARRSVVRSVERARARSRHWLSVIAQASEQCGRTRVPVLHDALPLLDWLASPRRGLLLDPEATQPCATAACDARSALALLAGPEGGLEESELAAARAAGLLPVSLGPRILRTETAALVALSVLQSRFGDLAS